MRCSAGFDAAALALDQGGQGEVKWSRVKNSAVYDI